MKTSNASDTNYSGGHMSSNSFSSFSDTKYGGLVEVTTIKKFRNSLAQYLTYVDFLSIDLIALHEIITIFRLLQIFGSSLVSSAMFNFWEKGTIQSAISTLSVFWCIIPPEYRIGYGEIISFLYIALFILFFLLVGMASYFYKKNGKVNDKVCLSIQVFQNTVVYLLPPIFATFLGEMIMNMINTKKYQIKNIFMIIIPIAIFIIYSYLLDKVSGFSLLYKPNSLQTISAKSQFTISNFAFIISFISGLGCYCYQIKILQMVFFFVDAVLCICCLTIFLRSGGIINNRHEIMFFATLSTSAANYIIVAISIFTNQSGNEIYLITMIIIFILFVIFFKILTSKLQQKELSKLDLIADNPNNFSDFVKSPKQFTKMSVIGFRFCHTICINWEFAKMAGDIFPYSIEVWTTFSKFVAIYPEENQTLELINQKIRTNKIKGYYPKLVLEQIGSVLRLRESNLDNSLKRKLNKISKIIEVTKRKHQRIWDLVIQGNISEMGKFVSMAHEASNKCEMEFHHLLSQYPNNRFVARSYARYLREIKADQQSFAEWIEKIRLLQRSVSIETDRPHELGLLAFPLLPNAVVNKSKLTLMATDSENVTNSEIDIDDDSLTGGMEQTSIIKKSIDELRIPGTFFTKMCTVLSVLILLVIPAVVMLIYSLSFMNQISEPLNYSFSLSLLRSLVFQISAFQIRYVGENLPLLINKVTEDPTKKMFPEVDQSNYFPEALGYFNTTKEQLKFLLTKVTRSIEGLSTLRYYKISSKELDFVRSCTFDPTIPYSYFTNVTHQEPLMMSLQNMIIDFSFQATKILDEKNIDRSIVSKTEFINPNYNAENVATQSSVALTALSDYYKTFNNQIQKIIFILQILLCIGYGIYFIAVSIYEYIIVKQNSMEVYKCLTVLPKNVVSQVGDGLKILRKDHSEGSVSVETDTELSKQEENILKIFASAGEKTRTSFGDSVSFFIYSAFILVIPIIVYILICKLYSDLGKFSVSDSPHLDYLMGSLGYLMGCFLSSFTIMFSLHGYDDLYNDPYFIVERLKSRMSKYQNYYHYAKYGSDEFGVRPFTGIYIGVEKAKSVIVCNNMSNPENDFREWIHCAPLGQVISFIASYILVFWRPYELRLKDKYDTHDNFNEMWYFSSTYLYDGLFYNMLNSIITNTQEDMKKLLPSTSAAVGILIGVCFVIVILMCVKMNQIESDLKFALCLLLQCPVTVVTSSHKISSVLGGDFKNSSADATRDETFFKSIVKSLPDGIICANPQTNRIYFVNDAFERMFGLKNSNGNSNSSNNNNNDDINNSNPEVDNLMDKDIKEFFLNKGVVIDELLFKNSSINFEYSNPKGGTTSYLIISSLNTSKHLIISLRDESQIVVHNKLIAEERLKSDQLLSSILPPSLVKRVQQGETNISFAVQTASILFLDIVEFTPWCASNSASTVMATLNTLFKEFDSCLINHQTMTKMKCIGDCYMAAGGIFASVNIPSEHAKEVVEFGLETIQKVSDINEILGQKLQIRVGVNTGGPIVAGVLGIGKPTFEILGPAINMAQQMEHHGIPMKVHISRYTYELIYGDVFIVKERGEIQVKNGKINTYIVTGKNQ